MTYEYVKTTERQKTSLPTIRPSTTAPIKRRVLAKRTTKDTAFAEPGYLTAAAIPPVKAGPTIARSAPVGPITGPAPPNIQCLRNATTPAGKILVARIRCSVPCHVFLQVNDNRTGSGARVTLTGSARVGVPRKQLRRGPLNVTLYVDTGPFVNGKTRLP